MITTYLDPFARRLTAFFTMCLLIVISFEVTGIPCIAAETNKNNCIGSHGNFPTGPLQTRTMGSVYLSMDEKFFVVGVDDGDLSDLIVFDVAKNKQLWKKALPDPPSSVALTPNGKMLAVSFAMQAPECPHVELLNTATGDKTVALEDPPELSNLSESTQTVTFSPDGSLLAASTESAIRIWKASTGKSISAIEPPGFETRKGIDAVQDLAFSPDNKQIAGVSGRWPIVYLWNIKTGRRLRTFRIPKFSGGLGTIVFNSDGSLLAAGSTGPLVIWNVSSGKLINMISKPPDSPIGPISFFDRTRLLVSGVVDLKVWDVAKKKPVLIQDLRPTGIVMDTVLPLSSGKLVGLTSNGTWVKNPDKPLEIKLIEVPSGKLISTLQVPGRESAPGGKKSDKQ